VFVDGQYIGFWSRNGTHEASDEKQVYGDMVMEGSGAVVELQLLVENLGHINYDRYSAPHV
jgi:hypothetical protein